jgi:hypothetical protein
LRRPAPFTRDTYDPILPSITRSCAPAPRPFSVKACFAPGERSIPEAPNRRGCPRGSDQGYRWFTPPISLRRIVSPRELASIVLSQVVNDRTADSPVAATRFSDRRQDRFHAGIRDDSDAFPAQRAFHRRELLPSAPEVSPMPPRRELPLRGARDDPKAWPPSSAPLRPDVPAAHLDRSGLASP